ncbi:lytic murein transglycosylase, partial [Reinekea blandensis]
MVRFFLILVLSGLSFTTAKNFLEFPRTEAVIQTLVDEHGFDRTEVERWMAEGSYREESVTNIAAPAEKTKSYVEYKPMFLSWLTIHQGKKFLEEHQSLLAKAEATYGVPAEIIVAIIGIESRYGNSLGRHNTFNALGSLAVTEGRRADYFQREWIKFIVHTQALGMDTLSIKGSYAGATGFPQFMPTSYEAYAVDHDEDGDVDIWSDAVDAIGSVANYLRKTVK